MKKPNITKVIIQSLCGVFMLCMGICLSCLDINSPSSLATTAYSNRSLVVNAASSKNVGQFIKTNWLWFAIGGGVLVLLIVIIVCVSVVNHKKKIKKLKEERNAIKADLTKDEEKQETAAEPVEKVEKQDENLDMKAEEQSLQARISDYENLYNQASYPNFTSKNFPDLMDYIKLKMDMENQKSAYNNPTNIMPENIDVFVENDSNDERVRQIKKEYQEELHRIDEILHEQEKAKLREEIQKQKDIIDKLEEEYEIADNLLDELYKKDETEGLDENVSLTKEPVVEEKLEEKPAQSVEEVEEADIQEIPVQEQKQKIASGDIVITPNKKLTLQEAYKLLSSKQKSYFKNLRDYADKKPNSRAKETKNYVVVGCGNKHYIRLLIKRGVTIAAFPSENEEMMKLRLSGLAPVKAEETQIKIVDDNAFAMAKQMIDIRVEQVAKEKQVLKEIKKNNGVKPKKKKTT